MNEQVAVVASSTPAWAFLVPIAAGTLGFLGRRLGRTVCQVLAVLGTAAVALRKTADGWSLFVGPPALTSDLVRVIARRAGVHLYTETDCNVYANGPIIALHATQEGPVTIRMPRSGPISNALTGHRLGEGPVITLELKQGETTVLRK